MRHHSVGRANNTSSGLDQPERLPGLERHRTQGGASGLTLDLDAEKEQAGEQLERGLPPTRRTSTGPDTPSSSRISSTPSASAIPRPE